MICLARAERKRGKAQEEGWKICMGIQSQFSSLSLQCISKHHWLFTLQHDRLSSWRFTFVDEKMFFICPQLLLNIDSKEAKRRERVFHCALLVIINCSEERRMDGPQVYSCDFRSLLCAESCWPLVVEVERETVED